MSHGYSLLLHLAELRTTVAALGKQMQRQYKKELEKPKYELADLDRNVFPINGSIHTAE